MKPIKPLPETKNTFIIVEDLGYSYLTETSKNLSRNCVVRCPECGHEKLERFCNIGRHKCPNCGYKVVTKYEKYELTCKACKKKFNSQTKDKQFCSKECFQGYMKTHRDNSNQLKTKVPKWINTKDKWERFLYLELDCPEEEKKEWIEYYRENGLKEYRTARQLSFGGRPKAASVYPARLFLE
jgi:hypothetical protein